MRPASPTCWTSFDFSEMLSDAAVVFNKRSRKEGGSKICCLAARKEPDVEIEVHLAANAGVWGGVPSMTDNTSRL